MKLQVNLIYTMNIRTTNEKTNTTPQIVQLLVCRSVMASTSSTIPMMAMVIMTKSRMEKLRLPSVIFSHAYFLLKHVGVRTILNAISPLQSQHCTDVYPSCLSIDLLVPLSNDFAIQHFKHSQWIYPIEPAQLQGDIFVPLYYQHNRHFTTLFGSSVSSEKFIGPLK